MREFAERAESTESERSKETTDLLLSGSEVSPRTRSRQSPFTVRPGAKIQHPTLESLHCSNRKDAAASGYLAQRKPIL